MIKKYILTLLLVFTAALFSCRDKELEKRVVLFYNTMENKAVPREDKIKQLKTFIVPGPGNDSMAVFFYKSWEKSDRNTKKIKTKILDIRFVENPESAYVTTEDIITTYEDYEATFVSIALWVKENNVWYRKDKKSELYRDGVRIR